MMTYYLIGNEDGVRFVPSLVLSHVLPCMVYGVMSVDDDHCFSVSELHSFNSVVSEIFKVEVVPETIQDFTVSDFCRSGIKEPENKDPKNK